MALLSLDHVEQVAPESQSTLGNSFREAQIRRLENRVPHMLHRTMFEVHAVGTGAVAGTIVGRADHPGIIALSHLTGELPRNDSPRGMDQVEWDDCRGRKCIAAGD